MKVGTDRDRYYADRSEDLLALGQELVDLAQRFVGVATHLNSVAGATVPVGDLSIREARQLGRQTFAAMAAARKRRVAA